MVWIWLGIVIFLALIYFTRRIIFTSKIKKFSNSSSALEADIEMIEEDSFKTYADTDEEEEEIKMAKEIEFGVFVLLGVILLITTRPYLVKKLHVKESKTNLDRVIGMTGIVTEKISSLNPGEVKVDGKRWTAISDRDIKVGSKVEVLSIIGVKIKVKEID